MKQTLLCAVLLAAALLAPAAASAAPSADTRITACETSLDQSGRFMVAEGRMRTLPGAARLRMRFDLEVRTPARSRWTKVDAPNFGVWTTADPAPKRYVYAKRVENLAAPATYRMVVRFQWLDADGRRLASERRRTRACRQPDERADLSPVRVTVAPGPDSGSARYVVGIRNDGATSSGLFGVTVTVGGEPLVSQVTTALLSTATTDVEVLGPRCEPGTPIVVQVDGEGAVDERDETDNQLVRACPAG